jgi:hypothetical protein
MRNASHRIASRIVLTPCEDNKSVAFTGALRTAPAVAPIREQLTRI